MSKIHWGGIPRDCDDNTAIWGNQAEPFVSLIFLCALFGNPWLKRSGGGTCERSFVWRLRLENPGKSRRTICCLKKAPFRRTLKFKSNQNIICRSALNAINHKMFVYRFFSANNRKKSPGLPTRMGSRSKEFLNSLEWHSRQPSTKFPSLKVLEKSFVQAESGNWYFYQYFPFWGSEVSIRNRRFPSSCQLKCQPHFVLKFYWNWYIRSKPAVAANKSLATRNPHSPRMLIIIP